MSAARYLKFYTFIIYILEKFKWCLIVEGHFVGRVQHKVQRLTLTWSPIEVGWRLIYYELILLLVETHHKLFWPLG